MKTIRDAFDPLPHWYVEDGEEKTATPAANMSEAQAEAERGQGWYLTTTDPAALSCQVWFLLSQITQK